MDSKHDCLINTSYLFYNDYETSYTTYIIHARWHRFLKCSKSFKLKFSRNAIIYDKNNLKRDLCWYA